MMNEGAGDRLKANDAARARVEGDGGNPVANPAGAQDRADVAARIAENAKRKSARSKTHGKGKSRAGLPGSSPQKPVMMLVRREDIESDEDLPVAPVQEERTEYQLWRGHVQALEAAVKDRKPTIRRSIMREMQTLDDEAKAIANRRELVAQTEENDQRRREADLAKRRAEIEGQLQAVGDAEVKLADRRSETVPKLVAQRIATLDQQLDGIKRKMKVLGRLKRETDRKPAKDEDLGATPERADKPSLHNTIDLLETGGKISHDQAQVAAKILAINEAISAAGQVKAAGMEGGIGRQAFSDIRMPSALDEVRSRKYLPWCRALSESTPATLDIVIKVVVMGLSLDAVARKHRMRRSKALEHLKDGLDAYARQRKVPAAPGAATSDVDAPDRK